MKHCTLLSTVYITFYQIKPAVKISEYTVRNIFICNEVAWGLYDGIILCIYMKLLSPVRISWTFTCTLLICILKISMYSVTGNIL